ncbi:MAG: sigma 54-interacting transcriptional regulator [Bacillota bacterium]
MDRFISFFKENEQVFESLANAIIAVDQEGKIKYINSRGVKLLGKEAGTCINKHITELYTESKLGEVAATNIPQLNMQIEINGHTCITNRLPLYYEGRIVGAVAIFDDITKYLDLNKKLEADSNELAILKLIMETAYDGIIVVDSKGYITMISNAYKKFLRLEDADVIGRHVTDVIENTRMHIVVQTGVPEYNDFQEIRGDYMVATRIPYYVDGRIAGAIGKVIFRNVSELDSINKKYLKIEQELKNYKSEIKNIHHAKYDLEMLLTQNENMLMLKHQIKRISYSKSNVLLLGESGTGKELIAHSIHMNSPRADMAFVKVNCAAIPDSLLESELFGYEKGAFTGADKNGRIGKFELAHQGTIFLDEIGDMPLQMQAKILRILQEGEMERVGSNHPRQVDVRIIAATNKDLKQMVEAKTFRADLYYRLNVISLSIPPLRERKEDIPVIAGHFIKELNMQYHRNVKGLSNKALHYMNSYSWPGNIRELRNVVERAYNIMEGEQYIQPWHLPGYLNTNEQQHISEPLSRIVDKFEKKVIMERLLYFKGNKTKAAEDLGISRVALHKKLEKYGLK